jgi:hypothetical protein
MTEETKDTQPAQSTQDAAGLTVQDLAGLKSIIDVASQRGAFKAPEMAAVGTLYNKLSNFLETITKEQPQNG